MPRRISVLLIEDDEDDRILAQALLTGIDEPEHVLTWARSFDEGLRRLTEEHFDVCLLDYALGERTGMELLSQALTAGVEVPIIFLTGQTARALDVEATRLGAADYLVKGKISSDQLERAIRYAIEQGRSFSSLRQLNRELEQTRDQAIRANHAKSGFLSTIGRACGDGLAAILERADALQERLAGRDPAAEDDLREIRAAGQRLRAQLADILDADVREVEAPTPEIRRIDIPAFVSDLCAAVLPLIGHNDNTFESSCSEDLGSLATDPTQLRRVLLNLLGNTCKFTRRGRIRLAVSRLPGLDRVEFSILPSGLWMSPEQIELTFTNFPQADAGESPVSSERESGIARCRRVCALLGGELLVETEGPRRPALRIRLPASGR